MEPLQKTLGRYSSGEELVPSRLTAGVRVSPQPCTPPLPWFCWTWRSNSCTAVPQAGHHKDSQHFPPPCWSVAQRYPRQVRVAALGTADLRLWAAPLQLAPHQAPARSSTTTTQRRARHWDGTEEPGDAGVAE